MSRDIFGDLKENIVTNGVADSENRNKGFRFC
jgi:hypothetical protein